MGDRKLNFVVVAPDKKDFASRLAYLGASLGFDPEAETFKVKGELNYSQDGHRLFYLVDVKQMEGLKNMCIIKVGEWQKRPDRSKIDAAIRAAKVGERIVREM